MVMFTVKGVTLIFGHFEVWWSQKETNFLDFPPHKLSG